MSLSEEKMMILKMLQEGRINSDEAARLLEALESGKSQGSGTGSSYSRPNTPPGGGSASAGRQHNQYRQGPQHSYYDEVARLRERINEWRRDISKNINQKNFDKMVDDISAKAEKIGKDVASVTYGVVDKVVDFVGSFVETGAFNIFGSCVLVEKTFDAPAIAGSSLNVQATNGQINIKKYQEDKILIKAKIRTPQSDSDEALVFTNENNEITVRLAKPDAYNLSVSYDIYIPAVKLNKIFLETKNSKISVEDTLSNEFIANTKNGAIELTGVTSGKLTAATRNAKITANYLIGSDVNTFTSNAMIEMKNLKVEKLTADTFNGKIMLENIHPKENTTETNLNLKTKNSDIKVNMNDSEDMGYKISARTSNADINLLIPNILYRSIPRVEGHAKQVDAETQNYTTASHKVNIIAETTNSFIEVIK